MESTTQTITEQPIKKRGRRPKKYDPEIIMSIISHHNDSRSMRWISRYLTDSGTPISVYKVHQIINQQIK